MRVTAYVTITHWTENSPECEILYHTQHGTGLMRSYGRLHVPFPAPPESLEAIVAGLRNMITDRLGPVWWNPQPWGAVFVPELGRDDQTTATE
jgi:hypothetical protein